VSNFPVPASPCNKRDEQCIESPREALIILVEHTVSQLLQIRRRGRRTAIDDDALRHAEGRVCRHLHGAQMTRRETERAKLCGTVPWRIVACLLQVRESHQNTMSVHVAPLRSCAGFLCVRTERTEDTLTPKPTRKGNGIRERERRRNKVGDAHRRGTT
jgi:hypothetical protein